MNGQKLLDLAACASRSSQEAKKAEAHARASRVYAKKAERDARDAQISASRLLQFSRQLILHMLHSSDEDQVSQEDLDILIKIANTGASAIDSSMLHTLINCDKVKFDDSESELKLYLNEDLLSVVEEGIGVAKPRESGSDSESDVNDKGSVTEHFPVEPTPMEVESFSPSTTNRMNFNLQSINPNSNKRKMKQQKKGRAAGALSPLLSKEEITIVKRATSPSTSQHSGINPLLGPHHKYTVRMKHSTSSLHSVHDDDERIASVPVSMMTHDDGGREETQRPYSATP